MVDISKFSEVKDSIQKGLESLNKYHEKVNDTDAYFICLCRWSHSLSLSLLKLNTFSSRSKHQECVRTREMGQRGLRDGNVAHQSCCKFHSDLYWILIHQSSLLVVWLVLHPIVIGDKYIASCILMYVKSLTLIAIQAYVLESWY